VRGTIATTHFDDNDISQVHELKYPTVIMMMTARHGYWISKPLLISRLLPSFHRHHYWFWIVKLVF